MKIRCWYVMSGSGKMRMVLCLFRRIGRLGECMDLSGFEGFCLVGVCRWMVIMKMGSSVGLVSPRLGWA